MTARERTCRACPARSFKGVMSDCFHVTYRLKLFVLSLVKDMRILTILDSIFHVPFLPYQWHRLLGRPYHGIWLASPQGNPFRYKYMAKSIDYLAV